LEAFAVLEEAIPGVVAALWDVGRAVLDMRRSSPPLGGSVGMLLADAARLSARVWNLERSSERVADEAPLLPL